MYIIVHRRRGRKASRDECSESIWNGVESIPGVESYDNARKCGVLKSLKSVCVCVCRHVDS